MNVIPFQFDVSSVRVVTGDDGDVWFVAKDIALDNRAFSPLLRRT